MTDTVDLKCPKCGFTFTLADALVQPAIIAAVQDGLRRERDSLREQAQTRAREEYAAKLLAAEQEITEKRAKLAEAEKAELQARKERREAEEAIKRVELEVERRLDERCALVRGAARQESEELHKLELAERDKLIADLRKNIEDLHQRGEQTSIQLKGETLELRLEAMLRAAFPRDSIEPVPHGRSGGDLLQNVIGPNGRTCGAVLWEFKSVKTWSAEWLAKCRNDQRKAGAQVAVIVSTTLPKDVQTFERIDGVWVSNIACTLPLAKALRTAVVELSLAALAMQGRKEKTDLIYSYIMGPEFRARVAAIVEACGGLNEGVESEKRFLTRHWAKQSKHLELLISATAGIYGDFQAIGGKSLPEVEGLTALPEGVGDVGGDSTAKL
jgi:hypothetical protein